MRVATTAALVVALVCAGAPAAASADDDPSGALPTTSGFGGVLAWSEYNSAADGYQLMARRGGLTQALAVRVRSVPFDVDVGPDSSGHPVAVYSRCAHEPRGSYPMFYRRGSGCQLYEYRFDAGSERRLSVPVPRGSSAVLPSVWGSSLAYTAGFGPRHEGRMPQLFIRTGRRAPIRVPGGPAGGYYQGGDRGPGPVGLDLRGSGLLFAWQSNATHERGCGYPGPQGVAAGYLNSLVAIDRPHRKMRLVKHGGCKQDGNVNGLTAPGWLSAQRVSYISSVQFGDPVFTLARRNLQTGAVDAFTQRDQMTGYSTDGQGASILAGWRPITHVFFSFDPVVFTPTGSR
jgi:hypothetical protein